MALIIVTVVTTLATSMVWQQWRAVQVETAERESQQSEWMLTGGMEYAKVLLRSDNQRTDHLNEPWAMPLAEARLSTFLAADEKNTLDAPDVFLSGGMIDVQARFNLRNVVDNDGKPDAMAVQGLLRLCKSVNVNQSVCQRLADRVRDAIAANIQQSGGSSVNASDAPLMPSRVEQLTWLGLDAESIRRLAPYVAVLPVRTPVNINTASKEVVVAVIPGIDLGSAERLIQARRNPFSDMKAVQDLLGLKEPLNADLVSLTTSYFFVQGRLRSDSQVLEQRSLIQRNGRDITTEWREWVNSSDPG